STRARSMKVFSYMPYKNAKFTRFALFLQSFQSFESSFAICGVRHDRSDRASDSWISDLRCERDFCDVLLSAWYSRNARIGFSSNGAIVVEKSRLSTRGLLFPIVR